MRQLVTRSRLGIAASILLGSSLGCGEADQPLPADSTQGGSALAGQGGSAAGSLTVGVGGAGGAPAAGAGGTAGAVGVAGGGGADSGGIAGLGGTGGADSNAGAAGSGGSKPTITFDPLKNESYDEMPLFVGAPPNLKPNAPAEGQPQPGNYTNVSVPTLRRYPMNVSKATGFGYVVFPGGAYSSVQMAAVAEAFAKKVGPLGIAVFGVKYRVGGGTTDAPRDALIDAKRAMRIVRQNASHWGVDPSHLGVLGHSAGTHVIFSLATHFDDGDAASADPIERQSSRPAFLGSMATWSFGSPSSPFEFTKDSPPAFMCHAEDDNVAPAALPRAIDAQLKALGVPSQTDIYATGGHGTCLPQTTSAGHNWHDKLWPWLQMHLQ